jgi:nitroreductase
MSSEAAVEPRVALETLRSRRSVPALLLRSPGPSQGEIDAALEVALRAPDHGALRPWRFVLIRGEARERFAERLAQRMRERDPQISPAKIDKAQTRVRTAPLVIAVGAHIRREHKVPEVEQLLSTGAAVMNLLNGFHAQGFGAIWLTGDNAYDRQVATDLGFAAEERCLGFVYVGSRPERSESAASEAAVVAGKQPPRATREGLVREWPG